MVSSGEYAPDSRDGWIVLAAGTIAVTTTFGTPFSFGVFLSVFSTAFGHSTVTLATIFSTQFFTFFVGAGVVSIFGTRFPPRRVILACAVITAGVAPSLYVVDSVPGLLVVFGVLGTVLGTVYIVLAGVVPRWFQQRRGVATGVLFSGIGIGLFVFPPAWQAAFDLFGVRRAFLYVLLGISLALLLAGIVCRRPPWLDAGGVPSGELSAWLRARIRSRPFAYYFVGIGLAFGWYYLLSAFSLELFVERGMTERLAAVTFGLIGGTSIPSRIGSGLVADRVGNRRTFMGSLTCVFLGSIALFSPEVPALVVAVILFGVGFGGISTIHVALVMELYDPDKSIPAIGVYNIGAGLFALGLPPLGTVLLETTGSFTAVLVLTTATTAGALFCFYKALL